MRSDWVSRETLQAVAASMQPINRLICELAADTGLRIDDVCSLKTEQLHAARLNNNWLTVVEKKTGKQKKLRLRNSQLQRLQAVAGSVYVFEHRTDKNRHRTRQSVWCDMKKCGRDLNVNLTPHSLRKLYAVEMFDKHHDVAAVQRDLNHSDIGTTLLYVLSRELTAKK